MADDKKQNGGKEKKVRRSSALKREIQNERRNIRNRSFKAKVSTAIRSFKAVSAQKDSEGTKTKLDTVYSLMDKGVKKGVYKINKANRVKSRLTALSRSA